MLPRGLYMAHLQPDMGQRALAIRVKNQMSLAHSDQIDNRVLFLS